MPRYRSEGYKNRWTQIQKRFSAWMSKYLSQSDWEEIGLDVVTDEDREKIAAIKAARSRP